MIDHFEPVLTTINHKKVGTGPPIESMIISILVIPIYIYIHIDYYQLLVICCL